ncbi:hypothetical protein JKP88DRAFT_167002, partial [Tribonema minus]
AARGGHVNVLQWLHELAPWNTQTTHDVLKNAASGGHVNALEWLMATHDWRGGGAAACAAAAAAGKLGALQHLLRCGSEVDHNAFSEAAACGQVELMEWALVEGAPLPLRLRDACRRATRRGQRASLEWLESTFFAAPWDEDIFSCAAYSGDMTLLQWLHERGCPWDDHASRIAAIYGDIVVLEWLRTAGAPIAVDACDVAYDCEEMNAFEWAYGHGLPIAGKTEVAMAARGDVSRLDWLRARGHVFHSPPDMWAVADFSTMRWLHKHEFPCNAQAMHAALGNAEAMLWLLYEVGSSAWDGSACVAAASEGDPTSLALLHMTCRATGGGHDQEVCAAAAAGGYGDVLRWARGEGCAWDQRVCVEARVNGHLDVLRWAFGEAIRVVRQSCGACRSERRGQGWRTQQLLALCADAAARC